MRCQACGEGGSGPDDLVYVAVRAKTTAKGVGNSDLATCHLQFYGGKSEMSLRGQTVMCRVVVVGMGREAEQSVNRRGVVHCSELYGKGRRAIVEVRASRIQRAACLPFPTSHLKFHPFLFISPSLSTPLHLPTSHQHNLQNGRQRRPGTLNLCGSSSVRRDRFFSTPRRDNEALRAHSRLSFAQQC